VPFTDEQRERYAADEAHRLAAELDSAPKGAATSALVDGGRYFRLGGYVAAGFLSMSEAEAAAQGIRDRDRRRRFLTFVRNGKRKPLVPYIPDGEAPSGSSKRTRKPRRIAAYLPPPSNTKLPPVPELHAAIGCAELLDDDGDAAAWLRERGINPAWVAERWLAYPLKKQPAAAWARVSGEEWFRGGYRLLLPLWSPRGELASMRARFVGSGKAVSPAGYGIRGLVLADRTAAQMLASGKEGKPRTVLVAEGEPDFLTWASVVRWTDSPAEDVAVLGLVSGSWTDELTARIPSRCTVHVRTDGDDAGARYLDKVRKALAGRCSVYRAVRTDKRDDNDLLRDGELPHLEGVPFREGFTQ